MFGETTLQFTFSIIKELIFKFLKMRMRLFADDSGSPVPQQWEDDEITAVITPYSKVDNSFDSGFKSQSEISIEIPSSGKSRRFRPRDARRSLFLGKRLAEDQEVDTYSPASKKARETDEHLQVFSTKEEPSASEHSETIVSAVDRLTSDDDLIADGSRVYCLPTISGKHKDLKTITPDTMADVVDGCYGDKLGHVTIIDCRYPYEYEGGHIKGAVNLYNKDAVHSLLQTPVTSDLPHVLIFHCEFSSERGPKMYRFLRNQDRELNKDSYPRLVYPEIYVLEGGYKAFFEKQKNLCDPISYKPMLHVDHGSDLRHFRKKSKSWTAGEKQKKSFKRTLSRLNLAF